MQQALRGILSAFLPVLLALPLLAQAKKDPPADAAPAAAMQKVNAHIEEINRLGQKLKNQMKAGFPPVRDRDEAMEIVEATFQDIVRFKAHYELAKATAKLTPDRDTQRMRVRGMKNAYFPGDFLDYLPLIEKLQKHVQKFHVQVDALDWYARYEKCLVVDKQQLEREFPTGSAKGEAAAEVVPIGQAVEAKLVEAAVAGDGRGTSSVKLLIRNLSDRRIVVSVPVWTALMPDDKAKQVMLVRESIETPLSARDSKTLDVSVVCADIRTKGRPSQNFSVYRFGDYPNARDLAAIQNIIGVADIIEVKGGHADIGIPPGIRPHVIIQFCIWRHLARERGDAAADMTSDAVRPEVLRQLGEFPGRPSSAKADDIAQDGKKILDRAEAVLHKLDI